MAGAGVPVCKHGNRAASSQCGAADLLEALGVVIELSPAGVARCVEEAGIGFCLAPRFHPALRHAGPARREMGIGTAFNVLGPMANPGRVRRMLLGVADVLLAERMLAVLKAHGSQHVLLVHGDDGLDELSTTGPSTVFELATARSPRRVLDPRDLGLPLAQPADLRGGDPATNAGLARRVLDGHHGPHRDIVVLNAGAALVVGGAAASIEEGMVDGRGRPGRRAGRGGPGAPADVLRGGSRGRWTRLTARDRAGAGVVGQPRAGLRHPRPRPEPVPRPVVRGRRRCRTGRRGPHGGGAPRRPGLPPARRDRSGHDQLPHPDGPRPRLQRLGPGGRPGRRARPSATVPASTPSTRPSSCSTSATALEGHADNIAPSIFGGVVASAGGHAVRVPLPFEPAVVVWVPPSTTSTDQSRAALCPSVPFADAVFNVGRTALLVAALAAGNIHALRTATEDRLHQDQRFARSPGSRVALEAALDAGAWCGWLSGSGPTIAALCAPGAADELAAALPPDGHTKVLTVDTGGAVLTP